jgi:hypothetical protein
MCIGRQAENLAFTTTISSAGAAYDSLARQCRVGQALRLTRPSGATTERLAADLDVTWVLAITHLPLALHNPSHGVIFLSGAV